MNVLFGISYIIWGNWHQPILLPDLYSVGKANDIEVVFRPQVLEDCEESFFGLKREQKEDQQVNGQCSGRQESMLKLTDVSVLLLAHEDMTSGIMNVE